MIQGFKLCDLDSSHGSLIHWHHPSQCREVPGPVGLRRTVTRYRDRDAGGDAGPGPEFQVFSHRHGDWQRPRHRDLKPIVNSVLPLTGVLRVSCDRDATPAATQPESTAGGVRD
jgi:hypothetical protein